MVLPCWVDAEGSSLLHRRHRRLAGGTAAVPTVAPEGLVRRSKRFLCPRLRGAEKVVKQRTDAVFRFEDTLEPCVR